MDVPQIHETNYESVPDWIVQVAKAYGWHVYRTELLDSLYRKGTAYRLFTDTPYPQQVVLKPFRGTRQQIKNVAAAASTLWYAGYRFMPRWLLTKHRTGYVTVNDLLYYAVEWLEGNSLSGNQADMTALGRTLAELHAIRVNHGRDRHASNPVPGPTHQLIRKLQTKARQFRRQWPEIATEDSPRGVWFRNHGRACDQLTHAAWQTLNRLDVQRVLRRESRHPRYVHGDVTRPNIVVHQRTPYLIDWDRLHVGSTYMELAKAMANVTNLDATLILHLLDGYESVRPLQPGERALISALFHFPQEAWFVAGGSADSSLSLLDTLARTWDSRVVAVKTVRRRAKVRR